MQIGLWWSWLQPILWLTTTVHNVSLLALSRIDNPRYVAVCTAEGDNYLLKQHTVKYLLEVYQGIQQDGLSEHLAYVAEKDILEKKCAVSSSDELRQPAVLLEAMKFCSLHLLQRSYTFENLIIDANRTVDGIQERVSAGASIAQAGVDLGWEVLYSNCHI